MYVALSHVKAGEMKYALGIAGDTSQGAPSDALEFSASAGAAAFIMGTEKLVAECLFTQAGPGALQGRHVEGHAQ